MNKLTDQIGISLFSQFSRLFSLGAGNQKLSILIFHRVLDKFDHLTPYEIYREEFEWQLHILKRNFNVLPLSKAIKLLNENNLPANSVCITFDDGYKDNFTNALPILQKYDFNATFFIASGFLNGGMMWNDKVRELVRSMQSSELDLKEYDLGEYQWEDENQRREVIEAVIGKLKYCHFQERLEKIDNIVSQFGNGELAEMMMTDAEVIGLRDAGMEIGGHTVSHPILAKLNQQEAMTEIVENKDYLESLLSEKISIFAYPNGKPVQDYTSESIDAVKKAGYQCAMTTSWGVSRQSTDLFQLPRFTPWDKTPLKFSARLFLNIFNKFDLV